MIPCGRSAPNITVNHRYYYKIIKSCIAKYGTVNDGDDISLKRPMVVEEDINPDCTDNASSDDLTEPTNCCMSGCPNCVWIEYAEKLSRKYTNSSDEVQKVIMSKVTDPNMRAFLSMELRCRNLGK